MKVLTAEELAACPAGTIYSSWQPATAAGLHRKGETLSVDPIRWSEASLLPEPDINVGDHNPAIRVIETAILTEPDVLFAVFDVDDLQQLIGLFHQAPDMPARGMARIKVIGKVY